METGIIIFLIFLVLFTVMSFWKTEERIAVCDLCEEEFKIVKDFVNTTASAYGCNACNAIACLSCARQRLNIPLCSGTNYHTQHSFKRSVYA